MVSKEELYSSIKNKIENEGFPLRDKNDFAELRKSLMDECKLGRGHYGMVNKIIMDVLGEKNIVVPDLDVSVSLGNMKINSPKQEPRPEPIAEPINEIPTPAPPEETTKIRKNRKATLVTGS